MATGKSESDALKTVLLALPPCDRGPVCSYSPTCSPTSYTSFWREQTLVVSESPLDVSTDNLERMAMERWVLQLVHRELAGVLEQAESRTKTNLNISLDDAAANVIRTALDIRVRSLTSGGSAGPGPLSSGPGDLKK